MLEPKPEKCILSLACALCDLAKRLSPSLDYITILFCSFFFYASPSTGACRHLGEVVSEMSLFCLRLHEMRCFWGGLS